MGATCFTFVLFVPLLFYRESFFVILPCSAVIIVSEDPEIWNSDDLSSKASEECSYTESRDLFDLRLIYSSRSPTLIVGVVDFNSFLLVP